MKPRLDASVITAAALDLIEHQGVAALSARRLASTLGCEAMSLYNHVASMDALQMLVVDAIAKEILDGCKETDPAHALLTMSRAYLDASLRYPNAFTLLASCRWDTPNMRRYGELLFWGFSKLGLSPTKALSQARILGSYLNGAGLAVVSWRLAYHSPAEDNESSHTELHHRFTEQAVFEDVLLGAAQLIRNTSQTNREPGS